MKYRRSASTLVVFTKLITEDMREEGENYEKNSYVFYLIGD